MLRMWMAELSRRSGVPVATIKYYVREGLLHPGEATGATRSRYDDTHLARLRLVRALVEVGGLRLAAVADVLTAVDTPDLPLHDVLAVAQGALSPEASDEPDPAALRRVDELVEQQGWAVDPAGHNRRDLARALAALDAAGDPLPGAALEGYAQLLGGLAEREVATIATDDPATAVRQIVVRTVLVDPVLRALRRMAHEHVSARTLPRGARTADPS